MAASPWQWLLEARRFVLTSDQDWAPEWTIEALLGLVAELGIPLHVFRTNESPLLDDAAASGRITQGWHPNFGPGSSHGANEADVVAHMSARFPGCTSVRTHGLRETYSSWRIMAESGVRFASQCATAFSGYLTPVVHASGIRRLPIFLEDDIWFEAFPDQADLEPIRATLAAPGLKVLNFHAIHVGINTPSVDYYQAHRERLYRDASATDCVNGGAGSRELLRRVVEEIERLGDACIAFDQLCAEVDDAIAAAGELVEVRPPAVR